MRRLARRLTLEAREATPDGSGGRALTWRPLGEIWAEMTARGGREEVAGGAPRSVTSWRIMVRGAPVGAPSRPRPEQRLREGERVFDILAVAEADAAGRYLEILAEEGLA